MEKKSHIVLMILAIFATGLLNGVSAQNITNTLATGGIYSIINGANTYFTVKQSTGLIGIGTNATDPRAQLEIGGTDGLLVRGTVNSGTIRALGAGVRMHWYPRKGAFRVGAAESSYWDDDGTANPKISLYSIAIGSGANTNGKDGAMVVGDDAYFQTAYSAQDNSLTMRFIGGYRLWSSYPDSTAGVYMRHGQSGWSNYCDRNKKENFEPVNGEWVLGKIKNIPITKWSYKKTDPNEKYIGPMAQDFYAAFQLNGTDSLGINSISIDGVNMAGVIALEKRTSEIKATLQILIDENRKLKEQLSNVSKINDELLELRKLKAELQDQLNIVKTENEKGRTQLTHKDN